MAAAKRSALRLRQSQPMKKRSQLWSSSGSASALAMVIGIERMIHRDCLAEAEPSSIPRGLRQHFLAIPGSARKRRSGAARRPSVRWYSLSPNTTVGALKGMLRFRHQLGRDFVLLHPHKDTYPRALSDDSKTLRECGVKDCGTLRMTSPHKFLLNVYNSSSVDYPVVRPPSTINYGDGGFIPIYPSLYDTIATLKELIFEKTGYPPHMQLLDPFSFRFHKREDCTLESLGFNCSSEWQQIALIHIPTLPLPSTVLEVEY